MCTTVSDGHKMQSYDNEHTSVCLSLVLAAQWSGVSIWLDSQKGGGGMGEEWAGLDTTLSSQLCPH